MSCVICTEAGRALCSETCRRSATRELEANLASLNALPADRASARGKLVERNGQLTSALVGWRPSAPVSQQTAMAPRPSPGASRAATVT